MVYWCLLLIMQRLLLNLFNKMSLLPLSEDIGQLPPNLESVLGSLPSSEALIFPRFIQEWPGVLSVGRQPSHHQKGRKKITFIFRQHDHIC